MTNALLLSGQEKVKFKIAYHDRTKLKFRIGDLISLKDIENLPTNYLPLADEEVGSLCLVVKIPDDVSPFYNCVPADSAGKLIQTLEDEMELVS